jgi:hypothetical protein
MKNVKKSVYVGIAMVLVILAAGCVKEARKGHKKIQLFASCKPCEKLDGFVSPSQINDEIRKMAGKYKGGGGAENVAVQKSRGVPIPYMKADGILVPSDTKRIWPYVCK